MIFRRNVLVASREPRSVHRDVGTPLLRLGLAIGAAAGSVSALSAQSMKAEISGLSDVMYGQLANLQADQRRSQNVCVASNSTGDRYSVRALGIGPAGEFVLKSGEVLLPFSVEWSSSPGQSSGIELASGGVLTAQTSTERGPRCKNGPTASLTVVLRGVDLSRAREGDYSGTLGLLIAPE